MSEPTKGEHALQYGISCHFAPKIISNCHRAYNVENPCLLQTTCINEVSAEQNYALAYALVSMGDRIKIELLHGQLASTQARLSANLKGSDESATTDLCRLEVD